MVANLLLQKVSLSSLFNFWSHDIYICTHEAWAPAINAVKEVKKCKLEFILCRMELIIDLLELVPCKFPLFKEIHAQEMIVKWTLIINFNHGVYKVAHSLRQVSKIDDNSDQKVVDTGVNCLSLQTFFILVESNFYKFCELNKNALKDLIEIFELFLLYLDVNCYWCKVEIIVIGFLSLIEIIWNCFFNICLEVCVRKSGKVVRSPNSFVAAKQNAVSCKLENLEMLQKVKVGLNLLQEVKICIRCLSLCAVIKVLVYSNDSFNCLQNLFHFLVHRFFFDFFINHLQKDNLLSSKHKNLKWSQNHGDLEGDQFTFINMNSSLSNGSIFECISEIVDPIFNGEIGIKALADVELHLEFFRIESLTQPYNWHALLKIYFVRLEILNKILAALSEVLLSQMGHLFVYSYLDLLFQILYIILYINEWLENEFPANLFDLNEFHLFLEEELWLRLVKIVKLLSWLSETVVFIKVLLARTILWSDKGHQSFENLHQPLH